MSEQDGKQAVVQQRPTTNDPDAWKVYWEAQGQPWRTEPEIDAERQKYLAERRNIKPDWKQGIFAFKGIQLTRADIEWLLASHENGRGPVDWKDESQREREGLDLRGANLCQVDLHDLPLTRLCGGLTRDEWRTAKEKQRTMAAVCMEKADLTQVQLQGAVLLGAQLQGADLTQAQLQEAFLRKAQLQRANLAEAQLQGANLRRIQLEKASLHGTQLERADLLGAQLQGTDLRDVKLGDEQHIGPQLVDIQWADANLAVVNWSQIPMLGDEHEARQREDLSGAPKSKAQRLKDYQAAVRANRQLAVALQTQGLNEDAARFAYRAQVLQRVVLRWQKQYGRWFFSVFLAALTGYGYRLWRILIAYGFIISLCALAYYVLGLSYSPHLPLLQAFLESITAFHGRVFLELFTSNTPQIWITACEAIAGLVIEGVFIAMLTQRFFGK